MDSAEKNSTGKIDVLDSRDQMAVLLKDKMGTAGTNDIHTILGEGS